MATIKFKGIPKSERNRFTKFYELLRDSKAKNQFDSEVIWQCLPEYAKNNFISEGSSDPIDDRWDYLSWIDALKNSDQQFNELRFSWFGGRLEYDQLSWPSGGIEATEEIVKVFNGTIVSNTAI